MPEQTIYGLVDPEHPDEIRYVGRTNKPDERLRFHAFNAFQHDSSPRGLWVGYLWYAQRSPQMTVIEQESFSDAKAAVAWAKDRERRLISHFRDYDKPILNREAFWTCPTRKAVPYGVRKAWEQTHVSLFWFDHAALMLDETLSAIDSKLGSLSLERPIRDGKEIRSLMDADEAQRDHERGRGGLVEAIRAIVTEYPAVEVAPVDWLESAPLSRDGFDGWELSIGEKKR